ncbi:hypothetical protein BOTBODRAFT_558663 [Botryobasidium botryosum FD-172 SS1]|uniref:SET domain-containing protein n=1 Tax=Botryobasidium botryosum (strain FD-172 SS1) TaxID=930990 RepID=A0A067LZT7_BOTB1|nr:hypothetical protein BOTBODRAFT_558663 [Botryobasidium botryosum FD-172 SS1]
MSIPVNSLKLRLQDLQHKMERERELGPSLAPPPACRTTLIEQSNYSYTSCEGEHSWGLFSLYVDLMGHEQRFSCTPLAQLRPMAFQTMQAREHNKGYYLLCRVVTPPYWSIGTILCVEDPAGDVRNITIYNYPGTRRTQSHALEAIFPVGSVLAIREPLLIPLESDTSAQIYVYSPSDIVFVRPDDRILAGVTWRCPAPTPAATPATHDKWHELGDGYFNAGHFLASAVTYTRALEFYPNELYFQLQRGRAYLAMEYLSAALADATAVIGACREGVSDRTRSTALYLAARVEYALSHYDTAILRLKEAARLSPGLTDEYTIWEGRCRDRIRETRGDYDWDVMFENAQLPGARIDVAEFVGPMEVQSMPHRGGGRGVIATRSIKAGELILVSRAFAASFPDELYGDRVVSQNCITGQMEGTCSSEVLSQVISKIFGRPELAPLVFGLYAGPSYPDPPHTYPPPVVINHDLRNPLVQELDLDTQRIDHIFTFNAFAPETLGWGWVDLLDASGHDSAGSPSKDIFRFDDLDASEPDIYNPPSALFLLPSLFNHSCDGNTTWYNFRDIMVMRAIKPIRKGEEFTLPYVQGSSTLSRHERLKRYCITCDCSLCSADREDGEEACRLREQLLESLSSLRSPETSLANIRSFLCYVEGTHNALRGPVRPASGRIRYELAIAYEVRARESADSSFRIQAIDACMAALEAYGIVVLDKSMWGPIGSVGSMDGDEYLPISTETRNLVVEGAKYCAQISLSIVSAFVFMGDVPRARGWARATRILDSIFVGCGNALFKSRHKAITDNLI